MTVLSKLNRSDKTGAAMLNGETFIRRAMRWLDGPEIGERIRQEVPVRSRPCFGKDEQGSYMLEVRYGNRRLELKPKKSTIEVGEAENLIPTLETLRDAVNAGELDKLFKEVKGSRKFGRGR